MNTAEALLILNPYDKREAIDLHSAAALAGKSASTLRNWCERFGIGRRIAGGNWMVSRVALQMLLDGEMGALMNYHLGNRSDPLVTFYFEKLGLRCLLPQNAQPQRSAENLQHRCGAAE